MHDVRVQFTLTTSVVEVGLQSAAGSLSPSRLSPPAVTRGGRPFGLGV